MRSVLLSLDGISSNNWYELLASLLPNTQKAIKHHTLVPIQSNPHTSTQAIWAEALTAQPWYINGCVGYSRPDQSLNSLTICSEKNLPTITLLKEESPDSKSLIINAPLIMPKTDRRVWFSDGSLPLRMRVSPDTLNSKEVFERYQPRGFLDLARGAGVRMQYATRAVENELRRLECVDQALHTFDWQRCVWRISAFDQLTHLLGLDNLTAKDLICSDLISEMLFEIDKLLFAIMNEQDVTLSVVSFYSHSPCYTKFNLNAHLAEGGYLAFHEEDVTTRTHTRREEASELLGTKAYEQLLRSCESRLATEKTKAASPVAGCIFLNSKHFFADGIVADDEHASVCDEIGNYLANSLANLFKDVKISKNPIPLQQRGVLPIPDFIVNIRGVEFYDMRDTGALHPPRTTHNSDGMMLVANRAGLPSNISPSNIVEILNGF